MFGFLKEKLKSWIGKSREKIEKEAKIVETPKKQAKEIKVEKKQKQDKRKRTKEEMRPEREVTEKVMSDLRQEKVEIKTPEEKFNDEVEKREEEKQEKRGFFAKLRGIFVYKITKNDFEGIFSDLEMLLLENNVALEVVEKIKKDLEIELIDKEIKKDSLEKEIRAGLKKALENIILDPEDTIKTIKEFKKNNKKPFVVLFFGINGAGKTTSIAKLGYLLQKNNLSCVLAAADTFRAASIEQLQIHADRLKITMIKSSYGSDPSAVSFDAIKYAEHHSIDVVLIDTAGRMHTKENLLKEMEKICRVTKPDMKVFTAEAIAGNDATEQARSFNNMIGITGTILSKTDVDEKGGTIISISDITKKPILYLGTGQKYEDLELFNKEKFIKQLGL
jgi:fused signal recognition particle receptor